MILEAGYLYNFNAISMQFLPPFPVWTTTVGIDEAEIFLKKMHLHVML